ncbi:MAG TPA: hypothetical protein VMT64_07465, partial [Candidatus Binataceae bacterium]|nr:hypothetical protein [Candidatus Binataceae bacterium]
LLQTGVPVYQMRVDIADKAKLDHHNALFHDYANAFEEGHKRWMATEEHQIIKDAMEKAYQPGHEFLAKEKATEDIGGKVVAIRQGAKGAVDAINEITTVIGRINDIQNTIASAVEEQPGTTNEITRNVSETARGTSDIASNINGVASSAKATQECAAIAESSSSELAKVATDLTEVVSHFKLSLNGRHAGVAAAGR